MPAQQSPHTRQPHHLDRKPPLDAPARPRPLHAHARGLDLERESEDHPSLSQQRAREGISQQRGEGRGAPPHARAIPLSPDELEFVDYLRTMFGFAGAEAFVAQYGQHTIQRAVRDYYEGDRRAIRNPAGFIRWLVEQRHRPKP